MVRVVPTTGARRVKGEDGPWPVITEARHGAVGRHHVVAGGGERRCGSGWAAGQRPAGTEHDGLGGFPRSIRSRSPAQPGVVSRAMVPMPSPEGSTVWLVVRIGVALAERVGGLAGVVGPSRRPWSITTTSRPLAVGAGDGLGRDERYYRMADAGRVGAAVGVGRLPGQDVAGLDGLHRRHRSRRLRRGLQPGEELVRRRGASGPHDERRPTTCMTSPGQRVDARTVYPVTRRSRSRRSPEVPPGSGGSTSCRSCR